MPTTIKLRNSVTTTSAPSSLVQGEVAINITDKKVWVGNAATTPVQLLGDGGSASFTSLSLSGNLTFTGTGNRIIGDFSNATVANRVVFQTNLTNGPTSIGVFPNGTSQNSLLQLFNTNNGNNASLADFRVTSTEVSIQSQIIGTGTYLPITFYTNAAERLRIDTSGNVGIGTASPNIASGFTNFVVSDTDNGGIVYVDRAGGARGYFYANGTSSVVLGNTSSIPLVFNTADTERMRIDSSGNVGIGTSSPDTKLKIIAIPAASNQLDGIRLEMGSGLTNARSEFLLGSDGSGVPYTSIRTGNDGNSWMSFFTGSGPTERMRISSNGYVSINTTGTVIAGANNHLSIVATNIFNTAYAIGLRNLGTTTGGFFVNFANSSDTSIGSISQNTTTSVAYNTTSDYRLKENVAPMTGALAKVAQLKPCTFTWKSTGEASQGFIAHELQEVVPDAVTGEKDAVFPNGSPRYQGVDTSFLVATLTAAIQEQQAMIQELKQEVAKLKGV